MTSRHLMERDAPHVLLTPAVLPCYWLLIFILSSNLWSCLLFTKNRGKKKIPSIVSSGHILFSCGTPFFLETYAASNGQTGHRKTNNSWVILQSSQQISSSQILEEQYGKSQKKKITKKSREENTIVGKVQRRFGVR